MVVQVVPSGEVWIWNAVAYAASQFSTTWLIDALLPRSTCSHCGSLNALDQRVLVLPSTAAEAGNEEFSTEEAVAVFPCDSKVAVAAALRADAGPIFAPCTVLPAKAAMRASAAITVLSRRERERRHVSVCGMSLM